MTIDFNNLDFEPKKSPPILKSQNIDFENYKPVEWRTPETGKLSFRDKLRKGLQAQYTMNKAVLRVVGAAGGSLALLPGAGIRAAIELIPTISTDPDKRFDPGSLAKAEKVFEEIMSVPGKLITTEEEAKAIENIGLAMKPIEWSGELGRLAGQEANKGLMELGFESTFIEPLLATYGEAAAVFALPKLIKGIKNSATFRRMHISQRGLMVQSLADTIKRNPQMTQKEIIRTFENPNWRAEALKARELKTAEVIPPEKPIDFETKPGPKPPKPIKPPPEPKTGLGKEVARAIAEEKKPSPLAALKQKEAEIVADQIDFEKPIAEEAPKVEPTKFEPKAKPVFGKSDFKAPAKRITYKSDRELMDWVGDEMYDQALTSWEEHGIYQFLARLRDNPLKTVKEIPLEEVIKKDALDRLSKTNDILELPERLLKVITTEAAQQTYIQEWMEHNYPDVLRLGEDFKDALFEAHTSSGEISAWWDDFTQNPKKYLDMIGKEKPIPFKAKAKQKDITLYSGIPVLEGLKLKAELEAIYDKHVGSPVWKFLSETTPEWAGDKSRIVDAINKGLIVDYKKDPDFIELRDDVVFKIEQARAKAKELATAMQKFPPAEQIRISQVIQGSITAAPGRYKDALEVAEEFKKIEAELQRLGILGPDNEFKQLTKKAINQKFQEIAGIDSKIEVLKKRLEPIIRTSQTVRRVAEDVSEEIISSSTDETTGAYETTVNKLTEANEARIKEALMTRGFPEGESQMMIDRIKESVVPMEGRTGTLKEIRTQVEKVITKSIIQEIEKTKTYSPSMMARARNSIVKEIKELSKDREEILDRIVLHYKMSGKQYLRRAYSRIEEEKGFLQNLYALAKRPRLKLGYNIRRKDLSEHYKKYLGEIKRAPYLVYKGLSSETHDMYLMDMFDKISKNKDWAVSAKEWDNIMSLKGRAIKQEKYKDFKPLPVSKKLGPLSGAMVDPYIWDDLNQAIAVRSQLIKAWDSVLSVWKTGKVVYNPAAQARNFLSNTILADFAGVPHTRIDLYTKAARDMLTKSGYYEEARKTPLFGKEWMGAEVKQFLQETSELKRIGDESVLVKMSDVFKKLADKPGKMYQANEQYFKLLLYSHGRETGLSIPEAVKYAEKWIFNYQKIPPAIRWAKRWYSPFITFSYKAMPRMAETVVRKPWKIAKYAILLAAVEEITRRMYGESKEEVEREKKVLPDYMRRAILPGQLSHLRIPYKDKFGRSKYLDLSFILPWGDIAEQWGQSHIVGRPFLPNNPAFVVIGEIAFNEILFTGEKLTEKDLDTGSAYLKRIGTEIWRQAMPSLAGSWSYNKFMSALHGEKDWAGRERSVGEAVFDVFFGLKIRSIDFNYQHAFRIKGLKKSIDKAQQRFSDDYEMLFFRQPNMSAETKEKRYLKLVKRKDKDIQKIMDIITDIER